MSFIAETSVYTHSGMLPLEKVFFRVKEKQRGQQLNIDVKNAEDLRNSLVRWFRTMTKKKYTCRI